MTEGSSKSGQDRTLNGGFRTKHALNGKDDSKEYGILVKGRG